MQDFSDWTRRVNYSLLYTLVFEREKREIYLLIPPVESSTYRGMIPFLFRIPSADPFEDITWKDEKVFFRIFSY